MTDVTLGASVAVVNEVDAAAAALAGTPKPRKPSVSAKAFVAALKEATAREKRPTAAELAVELDMEKGSFDQRLNALRNDWKEMIIDKEKPAVDADGNAKPFPFVLADGRSSREGGEAGRTSKNAILAALFEVDAE